MRNRQLERQLQLTFTRGEHWEILFWCFFRWRKFKYFKRRIKEGMSFRAAYERARYV